MKEPLKQCPACSRMYVREQVYLNHLQKIHGFSMVRAYEALGRAKEKAQRERLK